MGSKGVLRDGAGRPYGSVLGLDFVYFAFDTEIISNAGDVIVGAFVLFDVNRESSFGVLPLGFPVVDVHFG